MHITTSRFGVLDAIDDQLVEIESGLLGFPQITSYVRVPVADAEGWVWLQAIEDPDLAFLAIDAFLFFPDYDLVLPTADATALDVQTPEEVEVLALVTLNRDESGGLEAITANLLGPLVVNNRTHGARQVVLSDSEYTTREVVAGEVR